jgi:NhaA family Na+:H+ antiporter
MATDIAFAVGVVSLLGSRVPVALKLFLLTLAVADDLGAIAVIAVFYSQSVRFAWLAGVVVVLLIVFLLRRRQVWYLPVYVVLGLVAWYFMLRSGVHATVAGVALGFLTPTDPLRKDLKVESIVEHLEDETEITANDVQSASFLIKESVPVGERFVNRLLPWTSFLIIPLFALVNAGVPLGASALEAARSSTVTWGVALGLVVGKTVGVFGAAMISIRIGWARMPRGATLLHMVGIAMAAGIGFTVALFVTGLAFTDVTTTDEAKVGILFASLVAGIGATVILRLAASRSSAAELAIEDAENAAFFAEIDSTTT